MAKLSTAQVRNALINNYLSKDADFVEYIAAQLAKEITRIYKNDFGYTDSQAADALKHSNAQTVITQYFFMHGDKWLREQYKSLA